MGRDGNSATSLLDGLHGTDCAGTEYSACRPVVTGQKVQVVYMEWCGDCGAADWEVV